VRIDGGIVDQRPDRHAGRGSAHAADRCRASQFSTARAASIDDIQPAHDLLAQRFRADLYVTRQARPLLPLQH
jgi:hypothetical protein